MQLEDQVAVVTGATRGIGKAVLRALLTEGAVVAGIYASDDAAAAAVMAENPESSDRIRLFKGSVSDRPFIRETMAEVSRQYGKIDILINNAGIARDQFAARMSEEEWEAVYLTNFHGTYVCCAETIPYMLDRKYGKIVNVVSVSGIHGREAQINYGASKGAVIGLTRMLARRYGPHGIGINAMAPGMIRTEMLDSVPACKQEQFFDYTHLKRPGEAAEIAGTIVFLAGRSSDYISGTVLSADGGFMR